MLISIYCIIQLSKLLRKRVTITNTISFALETSYSQNTPSLSLSHTQHLNELQEIKFK